MRTRSSLVRSEESSRSTEKMNSDFGEVARDLD